VNEQPADPSKPDRSWMCINPPHKTTVWQGDLGTCLQCGITNQMTAAHTADLRATITRTTEALATFNGRGINNWDIPSAGEVLDAWRKSLEPADKPAALDWHYGPTATDPDPGKMWHNDCGQGVMYLEGGHICGCGAQDDDQPGEPA
jgi:hypothetical protein